jgi:hypothetical protein
VVFEARCSKLVAPGGAARYNRISSLSEPGSVRALLARARRRAWSNLVWEQFTVGLACAAAGGAALLLVGTSILDWYWLVLLFVAGAGLTAWRTLRRMPSLYSVAQQVDERLSLHDTLSTALHFDDASRPGVDPAIVKAQREEAEAAAARIDPAAAWPVTLPRQTYAAAGLIAVVLALGVLRYGTQGSLDLRTPLIGSVADFFWTNQPLQAKNNKKPPRTPGEEPLGIHLDQQDSKSPDEPSLDDLLATVETPDVNAEGVTSYSEKTDRKTIQAKGEEGNQSEAPEDGETDGRESPDSAGNEGGDQAGSKEGQKGASPQNLPNENSSLLDKMRDAMSNLLSKLKIPPQTTQSAKSGQSEGKQSSRDSQSGQKGEKGSGQPQQGKGNPSDDADSGDDGQGEQQQAQAGQGKSGDKASDSSSNDSNSGVGKQDGNKDLRDAEQLAAMGKISEIFGKRAQNMTGEIMVEVNSGKQQQLRTAYTSRGATHREAGGEIHRDEVPLVYQDYVQQYFEKVRRPEAPAPKPETR